MITSIPIALSTLLFLTTLTTAQLILSNLQNITGFSSQCTTAYDTPIPQCDPAHFANGALCSCSSDCEAALGQVTGTLTSACQGTSASDDTLLGLFFRNEAVGFLCEGGSGGGCGSAASSGASSAPSSTPAESESPAATSSSSSGTSTTTSTIITTKSPSRSTTPSPIASSLVANTSKATTTSTTHSSSSATTTAARSSRSISPLAESGGGGSPFDISSDAAKDCREVGFGIVGTLAAVLLSLLLS